MPKSKPLGLEWRSSSIFIISTVGVGLFTDLFLYGLVVPVLPFILDDRVHLKPAQIQSNVSGLLAAYAGASFIFSLPAGIIADRGSSRQLPFLVGLTALLISTLLLFLGRTVAVLAVARILQGISAAVVWTVGLALILDTVGQENLGKTMGSIFSFVSIGELASPVIGGILYKKAGYAGVFAIGSALLLVDFIMRLLLIEKKYAAAYIIQDDEADGNGSESAEDHEEENSSSSEEDPLIAKKEEDYYKIASNRQKWVEALPIVYCLQNPRLLTAFILTMLHATLLATFDATIPTNALELYGFDSLKSGLLFIALVLPCLVLGPIAGWIVDRYGPKPAAVIGYGYLVPILILLRLVQQGGTAQIIQYCGFLALCGLGLGVIGAPALVEASIVVQRYHKTNPDLFGTSGPYAQLFGMNSMIFSVGLTLGPLVSGALKDTVGYGNMNLVLAVVCLIGSVLSYIYVGEKPKFLRKTRF
ncbi:hypothetical protein MMC07_001214 [Pseudocyphellaria aurata]|nr:hypothetical protein [Pseudocyphellaria aurata]